MVLVLVTVAAISLAGLASRSLQLIEQATQAERDLQRRWGVFSCERVLLARAEELIEREGPEDPPDEEAPKVEVWPLPAQSYRRFVLGGMQFEAALSDEDAKVNLNTVYRRAPERLREVASNSLLDADSGGWVLRMQLPTGERALQAVAPFQSWGQVFELLDPGRRGDKGRRVATATSDMTCWGSGRLNVRRCSDAAVGSLCEAELGGAVVRKLLDLRRDPEVVSLDELLRRLSVRTKDQLVLRQLLTDETQCHALWVTASDRHREWTSLAVDRPGNGLGARRLRFTW